MKPEHRIKQEEERSYQFDVMQAKENKKYIKAAISIEDIGKLLQGRHAVLLFLNDEYDMEGMLDIYMSDDKTQFVVSEELNEMIIRHDI